MSEKPVVLSVGAGLPDLRRALPGQSECEFQVELATSQAQAVAKMFKIAPAVVLIDLNMTDGSPIAVADFASYRHPDARIIFLSDTAMFSDGSLFKHCANVHAHIGRGMAEPDVQALIGYHADAGQAGRRSGGPKSD